MSSTSSLESWDSSDIPYENEHSSMNRYGTQELPFMSRRKFSEDIDSTLLEFKDRARKLNSIRSNRPTKGGGRASADIDAHWIAAEIDRYRREEKELRSLEKLLIESQQLESTAKETPSRSSSETAELREQIKKIMKHLKKMVRARDTDTGGDVNLHRILERQQQRIANLESSGIQTTTPVFEPQRTPPNFLVDSLTERIDVLEKEVLKMKREKNLALEREALHNHSDAMREGPISQNKIKNIFSRIASLESETREDIKVQQQSLKAFQERITTVERDFEALQRKLLAVIECVNDDSWDAEIINDEDGQKRTKE